MDAHYQGGGGSGREPRLLGRGNFSRFLAEETGQRIGVQLPHDGAGETKTAHSKAGNWRQK